MLKGRPTLEALAPLLEWCPAPVALPGWQRLRDGAVAARAWQERAGPLADPCTPADLAALELLASEASRLPLHLPEARVRPRPHPLTSQSSAQLPVYTGL